MTYLKMHVTRERSYAKTALVKLEGAIEPYTVIQFESEMEQMQKDGFERFLFDMADIRYVNCTGLGSLVATAENLERLGQALAMFNVNPKVKVVFDMLGLNTFFHIYATHAEALDFLIAHATKGGGGPVKPSRNPEKPTPEPAHLELATCCAGALAECKLSGDVSEGDLPVLRRRYGLIRTPHLRFFIIDCAQLESLDAHAERWLVQLSGELVAKGGCAALVALSESLRQQLREHEVEMAFEHYDVLSAARDSLERVLAKQPAFVHDIHRHDGMLAVTVSFGATLPKAAEQQVARNLEDTLSSLPWLKHLVLDLSRVSTLAPEVELQLNRAAERMKQRGGETLVAGAPAAVHASMQKDAGTLFRFYADADGARHEIESEFLNS